MHPHDRLKRQVLGSNLGQMRETVQHMLHRDRPLKSPRTVAGENISSRSCEITYRRVWLDPGPNAPLLKRIVKYPYALEEIGRPRRSVLYKGLGDREQRSPVPHPIAFAREYVGDRVMGNPLKRYSLRPKPLDKAPSIELWLKGRGSE